MAAGESSKQLLVPLCKGILEATGKGAALDEVRGSENLRVVCDAIDSLSKVCLAVCHIFNEPVSVGTTMANVSWFVDYSGPLLREKTVRSFFRQEGSFWRKQVDELIEKGATSAMLKPKLEEMHFHLSKVNVGVDEQMTHERIDMMIKMTSFSRNYVVAFGRWNWKTFPTSLWSTSNRLWLCVSARKMQGPSVGRQCTSSWLLWTTSHFSHVPGVLSQIKEFKAWIAKNKGVLCTNTLLQFIDGCTSTNVDFQKAKALVEQIPKGCEGDVLARVPVLMRYMLNDCLTQAWFLKNRLSLGILQRRS